MKSKKTKSQWKIRTIKHKNSTVSKTMTLVLNPISQSLKLTSEA